MDVIVLCLPRMAYHWFPKIVSDLEVEISLLHTCAPSARHFPLYRLRALTRTLSGEGTRKSQGFGSTVQ
jgi:hypothetical protein